MDDFITIGLISAATPKTIPILAIFEPTALPMARPGLLSKAAKVDTIISGIEVPKPRTTTPIIRGEIARWFDTLAAPSTKMSELQTRRAKPINKTMLGRSNVVVIIAVYLNV
jgi:hypothetical protein